MEKSHAEILQSRVLEGNLAEVERLTTNQQIRSSVYYKVLEKAITSGQIEVAKLLIRRGCLQYAYSCSDKEPSILHLAVNTRDTHLIKLLLENKAFTTACYESEIPPHFNIVHFNPLDLRTSQLLDHFVEAGFLKFKQKQNDFTIIHYAAERGNAYIIPLLAARSRLLEVLNDLSNDGSALHIAVQKKHPEVVKMLLKVRANPNVFNKRKVTPLYLAVQNQDIEISEILINSSFSKKRPRSDESQPKEIFFHRAENKQLAYMATTTGNVPFLRMLLSHGATANCESATGDTPLHVAVEKQDLEIVNLLLKHNARMTAADKKGFTPFHTACKNGNVEIVKAFMNHRGYNLRYITGILPLHLAAQGGHSEVVKLLLKSGADCKTIDKNGKSPISCALEGIREDTTVLAILLKRIRELKQDATFLISLEKLVKKYAKVKKSDDSILHLAVEKEDASAVGLILNHNACIDLRNKNGLTPLELATINASVPIIKLFLQREDRSLFGDAMYLAIEKGNTEILELFLKAGVSANLRNEKGLTPLHVAVRQNDKKVALLLLENGAKVDAPGREDFETPLFIAAEKGSQLVKILLDAYLTRNRLHNLKEEKRIEKEGWKNGYLSMYIAAYRGHERIVKLLLEAGVNPNSNFKDYLTPLHAAAQQGNEQIVRLLLKHGALLDLHEQVDDIFDDEDSYFSHHIEKGATFIFSFTPLLAALYKGHTKIVKLLLRHRANVNAQLKCFATILEVEKQASEISEYEHILTQGNFTYEDMKKFADSFNGYSPLYFAVEIASEELMQLFISNGADVHAKTLEYYGVIDLAIRKENEKMIKLLLSAGVDVCIKSDYCFLKRNTKMAEVILNYVAGKTNLTPLGIAVENGLEDCVEKLLKSDVNIKHKGTSLLFFALKTNSLPILKMLLNHGINVNVIDEGNSPLLVAVTFKNLDFVELLLNAGAKISPETLNEDSKNPLNLAITLENEEIVELLLNRGVDASMVDCAFGLALKKNSAKIVEKFLNHGVSVHKRLFDIFPISHAIRNNNEKVVELLLKKGVSLRAEDNDGNLLLHEALSNSTINENLIRILIEYGISVNARNAEGKTPVHLLFEKVRTGYYDLNKIMTTLKILILNGADPNQPFCFDEDEETLLEIALDGYNSEMVEFLILNGSDINRLSSCDEIPLKIAHFELRLLENGVVGGEYRSPIYKNFLRLVKEVTRRQVVVGDVSKANQNYLISSELVRKYHKIYQTEIELMKTKNICPGISYYDVLQASCRKIIVLTRNEDVKMILFRSSEVTEAFPNYADYLIRQIEIGRDRLSLLDSNLIFLETILCFKFPSLILEHILSFLSNRDLINLSSAFKKDMFF